MIPIGAPVKVHGRCGVVLPRAAAPFLLMKNAERRMQNIGRVPGVGYGRTDVHQLSVRVDIIPELVTAIDKGDGGGRR